MNRRMFLFPLLLPGLPAGLAQQLAPVSEPFQLSVNVDLVVLHATVRDRKGAVPPILREQDFEVYEDGVRQTIRLFRREDTPITAGLIVDHSGSMRNRIGEVVTAARAFVQSSSPNDQMFVVNFNEHVTLGLPPSKTFSNRVNELEAAISGTAVTGRTALYDAVLLGFERLQSGTSEKKVLLVISDGADNASKCSLPEVLHIAGKASALVYTIGIFDADDRDSNPAMLRTLARDTGGEAFFPKELAEVTSICQRIARDIRNQYMLGYLSTQQSKPGTRRTIRVTAGSKETGKLIVRTRSGYIAGSSK